MDEIIGRKARVAWYGHGKNPWVINGTILGTKFFGTVPFLLVEYVKTKPITEKGKTYRTLIRADSISDIEYELTTAKVLSIVPATEEDTNDTESV